MSFVHKALAGIGFAMAAVSLLRPQRKPHRFALLSDLD
jgi:hypothetical protein